MKLIYEQFIDYCKHKKYCKKTKLFKHRIKPGFEGGFYNLDNVLLCNYEDHCFAHYYRWLSYRKHGDFLAWKLMIAQNKNTFLLMCSLNGKKSSISRINKMKENHIMFFNKKWQEKYGDRNAGKRNILSGHMQKLNKSITKNNPSLRSKAGKIGGLSNQKIQYKNKTHFHNPNNHIQKLGNFVRWGIKIDNKRIKYKELNPIFIEYHKKHHLFDNSKNSYSLVEYKKIIFKDRKL